MYPPNVFFSENMEPLSFGWWFTMICLSLGAIIGIWGACWTFRDVWGWPPKRDG